MSSAYEFGPGKFRHLTAPGLSTIQHEPPPLPRSLSDIALWDERAYLSFTPFLLADKKLEQMYRTEGYNPILYQAYRDIFPPRSKRADITHWHADLIEYRAGVLSGGELFRSTGHWNNSQQIEIFQTLVGYVLILVAGYGSGGQQYLHQHLCHAGDMCILPPGAWHITYVVAGPALVFNIYTNADEMYKYQRQAPIEIAARIGAEGIELVASDKAASTWGNYVTTHSDTALLPRLRLAGWLTDYYQSALPQDLAHLEETIQQLYLQGWPIHPLHPSSEALKQKKYVLTQARHTSTQVLFIGEARYDIVHELTAMSNTSITLCVDQHHHPVVVKRAKQDNVIGSGESELQLQTQQMHVLRKRLGYTTLYPDILYSDVNTVIMPFYNQGSLYDLILGQDIVRALHLLQCSVDRLFDVACYALDYKKSAALLSPHTFLTAQVAKRLQRLSQVTASSTVGRAFLEQVSSMHGHLANPLPRLRQWLADGTLTAFSRSTAPQHLGIAAHGDFVANNVLVASPGAPTDDKVLFIDVRGRVIWFDGLPWWDPIMDLASMIYFFSIETALREITRPSNEHTRERSFLLSPHDLYTICQHSPAFQAWVAQDAHWFARLEVYIAIRLLGNVSIQMVYPPEKKLERALAIYRLFLAQFMHCLPLLLAS